MDRIADRDLTAFADALASKSPTPGGGGAAAVCGALAAALCSMTGRFTVGKKKYAQVEDRVRELIVRADALRGRLLDLADADAAAFAPLAAAWALPKDDPARADAIEAAALSAAGPPLEMVRVCGDAVALLSEMREKGSAALLSDVGCGALLAGAAVRCAALNVSVNTRSLRDREAAARIDGETAEILSRVVPEAERIAADAEAALKGGQ